MQDIFQRYFNKGQPGIVIERRARIQREGSPPYVWIPAAIAAGAVAVIGVREQFPEARKYEPLDSLLIVNNEAANNITVTINGQDAHYVPAGTIDQIRGRGVALWHIAITNDGGAVTTLGLIWLKLQKEAHTVDKWAADYG